MNYVWVKMIYAIWLYDVMVITVKLKLNWVETIIYSIREKVHYGVSSLTLRRYSSDTLWTTKCFSG